MAEQMDENKSAMTARATGRSRIGAWIVVFVCVGFIGGMAGMTYASASLYKMFCSLTGYGGATRTAESAELPTPIDAKLEIRFDANVAPGLTWAFAPAQNSMTVQVGASALAHYTAQNLADTDTYANATYNVMPAQAGAYFVKLQCFCFNEQTLGPKEKADMPVVFYVDPEIMKDPDLQGIKTITLSYTFFPAKGPSNDPARPLARAQEGQVEGGAARKPL